MKDEVMSKRRRPLFKKYAMIGELVIVMVAMKTPLILRDF